MPSPTPSQPSPPDTVAQTLRRKISTEHGPFLPQSTSRRRLGHRRGFGCWGQPASRAVWKRTMDPELRVLRVHIEQPPPADVVAVALRPSQGPGTP